MAPSTFAVFLLCAVCSNAEYGELAEANGLATVVEVRRLWGWSTPSWASQAQTKVEQAKKKALEAQRTAEKASTDAQKMGRTVSKQAAAAKKAVEEAIKNPTAALLKAALKAAGLGPTLVSASNDLAKKMPDLAAKVAKELVGDCKELKSAGCGTQLVEFCKEELVEGIEESLGVFAAKKIIKATDLMSGTIGKLADQAQCKVRATKAGFASSDSLTKALPSGAMDEIDGLSDLLKLVEDTIENVNKLLYPAKELKKYWDLVVEVVEDVLGFIARESITLVQSRIPDSVQQTVQEGGDQFIRGMVKFLQANLVDSITAEIEKYCPDCSSKDDGLGFSLGPYEALEKTIEKKLEEVEPQVQVDNKLLEPVAEMKTKVKTSGDKKVLAKIESDIASCDDTEKKFAVATELNVNDFSTKSVLEGITVSAVAAAALLASILLVIWRRRQHRVVHGIDDVDLE